MKKILFFVILAVGFVACKSAGNGTTSTSADGSVREIGSSDIAYIQMDSLVAHYNRYTDLGTAFEAKATKIQSDLEARARRLQNEMMDLEEKAGKGLLTRSAIATQQEQLQTKANSFENDRQTHLADLAEEEQVMMNQITNAITEYIDEYNKDFRYKMILSTSGGVPILHADPSMNITSEILEGLNAAYAAEPKTQE